MPPPSGRCDLEPIPIGEPNMSAAQLTLLAIGYGLIYYFLARGTVARDMDTDSHALAMACRHFSDAAFFAALDGTSDRLAPP